jgi:hypothetical protein
MDEVPRTAKGARSARAKRTATTIGGPSPAVCIRRTMGRLFPVGPRTLARTVLVTAQTACDSNPARFPGSASSRSATRRIGKRGNAHTMVVTGSPSPVPEYSPPNVATCTSRLTCRKVFENFPSLGVPPPHPKLLCKRTHVHRLRECDDGTQAGNTIRLSLPLHARSSSPAVNAPNVPGSGVVTGKSL